MTIIYERPFPKDPDGPVRQFTACCGASDKGIEGGVACRACYTYIDEYVDESNHDYFVSHIVDPVVKAKFDEFMADDAQTYREWHDKFLAKLMEED